MDADKLRFDFSWSSALTAAQVASVEGIVNARIAAALPVHAQLVSLAEATKITALRQVFGERYPDPVSSTSCFFSAFSCVSVFYFLLCVGA